ncbi:hypothetical protein CEXT_712851 [Caerostris extrusa]|uniref:Uncharacterized protein n=1 Tax=Caerostris extrusa TaxID=172846 RepID=A0AAV4PV57_CAEEX|nr:hypothetical protein CEXT_712851 [Caerostris extrusa]
MGKADSSYYLPKWRRNGNLFKQATVDLRMQTKTGAGKRLILKSYNSRQGERCEVTATLRVIRCQIGKNLSRACSEKACHLGLHWIEEWMNFVSSMRELPFPGAKGSLICCANISPPPLTPNCPEREKLDPLG